jgi:SAM-dependent methyltransferase
MLRRTTKGLTPAIRLNPQPDVATGTGWTARLLKARGADVTGVDIGSGVIEGAKELAPDIDFRLGDAEELEFPDGSFDVVTSTFGVMFVTRPEDAVRHQSSDQARHQSVGRGEPPTHPASAH